MVASPFIAEFIRLLKAIEVPFDALTIGNKSNVVREAYRANRDDSFS